MNSMAILFAVMGVCGVLGLGWAARAWDELANLLD